MSEYTQTTMLPHTTTSAMHCPISGTPADGSCDVASSQLHSLPYREVPFEIFDMIIDHLHGDKLALHACSLVCHAWLNSSRYHLFRSLAVEYNQWEVGVNVLKEFHAFLDAHPEVCGITRSLRLMTQRGCQSIDLKTLGLITTRFRVLKSVKLTRLSWTIGSSIDFSQLASQSVEALVISGTRTFNPSFSLECLISIFHLFPHATACEVEGYICGITGGLNLPPPPDLCLETLVLRDTLLFALIIHSIRRTPTLRTLRSLTIMGAVRFQLVSIGGLLKEVGPRLEHFGLEIGMVRSSEQSPDVWRALGLSFCTSLRSLCIIYSTSHILLLEPPDVLPRVQSGPSIIYILSQIRSSLQSLTLVLRLSSPNLRDVAERDLDSWDWVGLAETLGSLGSLQAVRFLEEEKSAPSHFGRHGQQVIRERMNARIRNELPTLWEAGTIRFT